MYFIKYISKYKCVVFHFFVIVFCHFCLSLGLEWREWAIPMMANRHGAVREIYAWLYWRERESLACQSE